jgi:hypothetical protein
MGCRVALARDGAWVSIDDLDGEHIDASFDVVTERRTSASGAPAGSPTCRPMCSVPGRNSKCAPTLRPIAIDLCLNDRLAVEMPDRDLGVDASQVVVEQLDGPMSASASLPLRCVPRFLRTPVAQSKNRRGGSTKVEEGLCG